MRNLILILKCSWSASQTSSKMNMNSWKKKSQASKMTTMQTEKSDIKYRRRLIEDSEAAQQIKEYTEEQEDFSKKEFNEE